MSPLDHPRYSEVFKLLDGLERYETSFGPTTVTLFEPAQLADEQIGYSVTPDGRPLVGTRFGDWKPQWLVVAVEDLTGDPFFVDLDNESLPVFSAMHGEGFWDPSPVSSSLAGFQAALAEVHAVSSGREHPVGLENNPISKAHRSA